MLCTSWRAVESFAAALAHLPYEVLVQGDDVPARLAARFRDEVASVLVATRTFFEGFDVQDHLATDQYAIVQATVTVTHENQVQVVRPQLRLEPNRA